MAKRLAPVMEVFSDSAGHWRWRVVNRNNGKTTGGSQETFFDKSTALREARLFRDSMNSPGISIKTIEPAEPQPAGRELSAAEVAAMNARDEAAAIPPAISLLGKQ